MAPNEQILSQYIEKLHKDLLQVALQEQAQKNLLEFEK